MRSEATDVEAYLDELPGDRRDVVATARRWVLDHLPEGYEEGMEYGMISYRVPLDRYSDTYNGRPLSYVSLAAQKNHYALYLHGVYMDPELARELRDGFAAAGKELDMGKSCLRFRALDDLPAEVVGRTIAALSPDEFIATYVSARQR